MKNVIDPTIKAIWIAALRSGEYKKTVKDLRNGDCFCAVGVLCDLHSKYAYHRLQWVDDTYDGYKNLVPH